MSEVSPWARLGGVTPEVEEAPEPVIDEEMLRLRDQVIELNRMVVRLEERVRLLEAGAIEPVENAFTIVSREELGIETPELTEEQIAKALEDDKVVVIESGFTVPSTEELEEKRKGVTAEEEPAGTAPTELSDEVVEEKEFGGVYATAYLMADLVADHIRNHGAILNNQVKKRVYTPNNVEVNSKDKQYLKKLIEAGETPFKAAKRDNFRTLYYIGDDPDEEYEKAFGSPSE